MRHIVSRNKILLGIYLPLTTSVLVLNVLVPTSHTIVYIKYATMLSLFLCSVFVKKERPEQKRMAASFIFLIIGDYFLVFSQVLPYTIFDAYLCGAAAFFCAYICLSSAYLKGVQVGVRELLVALVLMALLAGELALVFPHIHGGLKSGVLIFGLMLSFMTWTGVSTLFGGYYSKKASRLIALSACLMLICDFGVGLSVFGANSVRGVLLLKTIIWAAYIPAWTLLGAVIGEKKLLAEDH